MLMLEGYGFRIRKRIEEDLPMKLKPGRKSRGLFRPRIRKIYDPACKKRCTDALRECLTGCRI